MDTKQIETVAATAIGTLGANAGIEWLRNLIAGWNRRRDKAESEQSALGIRQLELDADTTRQIHDWWQEQVRENKETSARSAGWQERALKSEARIESLEARIKTLEDDLQEARFRATEEKEYLLGLLQSAGIESHLTRLMHEEIERSGSSGHEAHEMLPELFQPEPEI